MKNTLFVILLILSILSINLANAGIGNIMNNNKIELYAYISSLNNINRYISQFDIGNEFLCIMNEYKITKITFTDNIKNIPFVDFIICNNAICKDIIEDNSNIEKLNRFVIIDSSDSNVVKNFYEKISMYLSINKYNMEKVCQISNETCVNNNDCNSSISNQNICDIYYGDKKMQIYGECSRINKINIATIQTNDKKNIWIYRNVSLENDIYQKILNIYYDFRKVQNIYNFTINNVFLYPEPLIYETYSQHRKNITLYYDYKGDDISEQEYSCYYSKLNRNFKFEKKRPTGYYCYYGKKDQNHYVNLDPYHKYKQKYNFTVLPGHFQSKITGNILFKHSKLYMNDKSINFGSFETINEKTKNGFCNSKERNRIIKSGENQAYYCDNGVSCSYVYGYNKNYYNLCPPNNKFTLDAFYYIKYSIQENTLAYENNKKNLNFPSLYNPNLYRNKNSNDNDIIENIIIKSNIGDEVIIFITPDFNINDDKIDSYIKIINEKMIKFIVISFDNINDKYFKLFNSIISKIFIIKYNYNNIYKSYLYTKIVSYLSNKEINKFTIINNKIHPFIISFTTSYDIITVNSFKLNFNIFDNNANLHDKSEKFTLNYDNLIITKTEVFFTNKDKYLIRFDNNNIESVFNKSQFYILSNLNIESYMKYTYYDNDGIFHFVTPYYEDKYDLQIFNYDNIPIKNKFIFNRRLSAQTFDYIHELDNLHNDNNSIYLFDNNNNLPKFDFTMNHDKFIRTNIIYSSFTNPTLLVEKSHNDFIQVMNEKYDVFIEKTLSSLVTIIDNKDIFQDNRICENTKFYGCFIFVYLLFLLLLVNISYASIYFCVSKFKKGTLLLLINIPIIFVIYVFTRLLDGIIVAMRVVEGWSFIGIMVFISICFCLILFILVFFIVYIHLNHIIANNSENNNKKLKEEEI
jgi:hypothetical protein